MNKFCINIIIINIIFVTIYLLYDIFSNVENSFDKRNYKYLQVVNNTNKSKSYNILIKITLLIIFSLITLVFCNLGLQILSWIPTILLFLTFFMLFNFPLYIYITNSELDENIEEAEEAEPEEELNDECLNEDNLLEKNRIDRDYVRNQLYNLVINHYDNDGQNFEINEIKLYNDDISCNDDSSYNDISFNDLYDDEKLFVKEYVNNIPFINKFEMNLNHLIDTFYECCL
tara:strand:+ start:3239 stop:3928 length:690 start_codon:yes stop_codon:yes gene_type:complete